MPTPIPPSTSSDDELRRLVVVLVRRLRDARIGRYGSRPARIAAQIQIPDSLHHRLDEFETAYLSEVMGRIVEALGVHRRSHRAIVAATNREQI